MIPLARTALLPVLLALTAVLAGAPPALAGTTHKLVRTFGSPTASVPDTAAPLADPHGIAIDPETGDIYVADSANHRVQEFSAEGVFLLTFGAKVNRTEVALAGSPAEQDLCTALSGDQCQPGEATGAPGGFQSPEFLAIDPAAHDIYVADSADATISKFTTEGALIATWAEGGKLTGAAVKRGSFAPLVGIALDGTGNLYVARTSEESEHVCFLGGCELFQFDAGGALTREGPLGESSTAPLGLAIDPEGNLFTANPSGGVNRVSPAGAFAGFLPDATSAVAVEPASGDLYAAGGGALRHYQRDSEGNVLEPEAPPCPWEGCPPSDSTTVGLDATAIAASPAGVVLADAANGELRQYTPGLTIPDVRSEPSGEPGAHSLTLYGTVKPDEVPLTSCEFQYIEASAYDPEAADPYAGGASAPCEPGLAEINSRTGEPVPVQAKLASLAPGTVYHYRLIAENANDENNPQAGSDESASTFPAPVIESATVGALTASSAALEATINPEGTGTHYFLEYDTTPYPSAEAHGTRVPAHEGEDPEIAPGTSGVQVSAQISGLHADEHTYYWRVIATNESGTTTGVSHSFLYASGAGTLPDHRSYELVTPDHKNGSLIGDVSAFGNGITDVSSSGNRVMAEAIQCFAAAESCTGRQNISIGSPYEFQRTPSGWVTHALAPSATLFSTSATWSYNALEGTMLFTAPTAPADEQDFYVRREGGLLEHVGPNTSPSEPADEPVGGAPEGQKQAFSRGFSHIAWESSRNWPGLEENSSGKKAYEYAGAGESQPLLVGVLGGKGSRELVSGCGTELGIPQNSRRLGTMSADGRTVFFTADALNEGGEAPCTSGAVLVPAKTVYARIDGEEPTVAGVRRKAETVDVSDPSPSECGSGSAGAEVACQQAPAAPAIFEGASEDGSKAFFVSTRQLTDDAGEDSSASDSSAGAGTCAETTGQNGCNLYEYDFALPAGHELVDVSAGDTSGGGPRVRGLLAVAPDGSHVYFVAQGVLTAGANAFGQKAQPGEDNLYMFERDAAFPAGRKVFIATLAASDHVEWQAGPGVPANVSPDGRFLSFLSAAQLTPDDTSQSGAQQAFRYDAVSGDLNRISIGENGYEDDGNRSTVSACEVGLGCSQDAGLAQPETRTDTTMADDGSRVFFVSPLALTPGAREDAQIGVNGEGGPVYARNVYEWEQEGSGSCPPGKKPGCVFLISDGQDLTLNAGVTGSCAGTQNVVSSVCLLGTDASGDDVFIATVDQLTTADTNNELDYYDARVCEPEHGNPCVQPPAPPLAPCSQEECHGTPPPPHALHTQPSATFQGQGNVTPTSPAKTPPKTATKAQKLAKALAACRKRYGHRGRARRSCEAAARARYGSKHKHVKHAAATKRSAK